MHYHLVLDGHSKFGAFFYVFQRRHRFVKRELSTDDPHGVNGDRVRDRSTRLGHHVMHGCEQYIIEYKYNITNLL